MLTEYIKSKIKLHTLREIPNECCGLILQKEGGHYEIFECKNISFHKTENCILNPTDYINAEKMGEIIGHYHSQPSDCPSMTDNISAFNHNIYSIVYCWGKSKFYVIKPELKDYLNKNFGLGINDCFSLVKNYYKNELNIDINDYNRDENWHLDNPKIIIDNFKKEGFIEVKEQEKKINDVLLFGKNRDEIGHMAIYLGDNLMLHHPRNQISVVEYIRGFWAKRLMLVARYNYGENSSN